jgi:uncharacterized protein (TIGR00645 family)
LSRNPSPREAGRHLQFGTERFQSVAAPSAIKLLEGFMDVSHESDRELYWQTGIHLTFVVSTLVRALSDRFSHHSHPSVGNPVRD